MATADYWTRAWIIQEILLADNVIMISPIHPINLRSLLPFVEQHIFRYHEHRYHKYFATLPLMKSRGSSDPEERGHMPFEKILEICQNRHCLNVRDRIYSVLSLTSGGERLKVDYGSSNMHVLWEAVNFQWQHEVLKKQNSGTNGNLDTYVVGHVAQRAFAALNLSPPTFQSIKELGQVKNLLEGSQEFENRAYWTAPSKSSGRWKQDISLSLMLSNTSITMVFEWPVVQDPDRQPLGWKLDADGTQWWTSESYMRILDRVASASSIRSNLGKLRMKMHLWQRHKLTDYPAASSQSGLSAPQS